MPRSLLIAGVERIGDLERNQLDIQKALTYQIDTCSFSVKGAQPTEGEEVIVEEGGTRFFAGIINVVELDRIFPDKSIKVWRVDCDDYTSLLDRRLVVETYENMTADAIFLDIVTKYCPGFTTSGVQLGAPEVEYLQFDYIYPSECFKQICEYTGWSWQPDYYKDLQLFDTNTYVQPGPMELVPGGKFSNFRHAVDIQGLRNRVYILGGKFLSDPQTFEYVADGKERVWVLAHEPHSPSVQVSEVSKTIGLEHVDDEALYDFMYNQRDRYIRCSNQTTTPVDGATVAFTYKVPMDVISMVEDLPSQQALAVVQGGDGIYEHKIVDDSLITLEAAEAAGQADLREHANPQVRGSFATETDGWVPGQIVTINLPDRGVAGEFLVQKVTASPGSSSPSIWIYRVEYGGRLLGIADFLKALVSAQQKKKLVDVKYQSKFVVGDEKVGIKDEAVITPRTDPWYCGDVDAICGEIICLAVV